MTHIHIMLRWRRFFTATCGWRTGDSEPSVSSKRVRSKERKNPHGAGTGLSYMSHSSDREKLLPNLGGDVALSPPKHPLSTTQVPAKHRLSTVQVQTVIQSMNDDYISLNDIMDKMGIKHHPTFRDNYLNPALSDGAIERLYPDQPRHPK